MELNETTAEGAARETVEEAGAQFEMEGLITLLNVARVGQVPLFYRARLLNLDFGAGEESLEVALFDEADIPWPELAFRTISTTLHRYFEDRKKGGFGLHSESLEPQHS